MLPVFPDLLHLSLSLSPSSPSLPRSLLTHPLLVWLSVRASPHPPPPFNSSLSSLLRRRFSRTFFHPFTQPDCHCVLVCRPSVFSFLFPLFPLSLSLSLSRSPLLPLLVPLLLTLRSSFTSLLLFPSPPFILSDSLSRRHTFAASATIMDHKIDWKIKG